MGFSFSSQAYGIYWSDVTASAHLTHETQEGFTISEAVAQATPQPAVRRTNPRPSEVEQTGPVMAPDAGGMGLRVYFGDLFWSAGS